MFDPTSRYYTIEEARLTVTDRDGIAREIAYIRRRLIPQPEESVTLVEHSVVQHDRLDNISSRYLGDPLQFWQICDANLEMHPPELTDEPGESITIPLPTH